MDVPNSVLSLNGHLYWSAMWLHVSPGMHAKKHVFKKNWTMHSKYENRSNLHSWHNLEGLVYDHWMRTRICSLIMNKIFMWAPKLWGNWPLLRIVLDTLTSSVHDVLINACLDFNVLGDESGFWLPINSTIRSTLKVSRPTFEVVFYWQVCI